jgi:hypothetical protein
MHRVTRLLWLSGILLLLAALPAQAEIVVFAEGSFVKVVSHRIEEDKIFLEMTPGNFMSLKLMRIERILEDEVPTPKPVLAAIDEAASKATFTWRFDEAMTLDESLPYSRLIFDTAKRNGLNPRLVAAVMGAESAYKPQAVSHKGARGLMQLMPATAARFGLAGHQVFEPAANLEAGSRYLAWLADHFDGDLRLMLAGYNAGEGTVKRYGGIPPYRETVEYIRRIFGMLGLPTEA